MKAKLKEAMKVAMKARDQSRLETIRMMLSAIQYEEMNAKVDELQDEAVIAVLKRELKKRKEEQEFAEKASRADLIEKAQNEAKVIEEFLPTQLNAAQLRTIIKTFVDQDQSASVKSVMKFLKDQYAGQYDGREASDATKEVLEGKG